MGKFNNMPCVPGFGRGGDYTDEGTYTVEITNAFKKDSKDPAKAGNVVVIFEWKFLTSTNEKHKPSTSGSVARTIKPDPYGYTANDTIRFVYSAVKSKFKDAPAEQKPTEADVLELSKHLATALCETDDMVALDASIKHLAALGIMDVADFLRGEVVALEVKKGNTKKGGTFSYHNWSPVS